MTTYQVLLIAVAGFTGSVLSTLAGGAAIITLPLLLAAGCTPLIAITSITVALVPGLLLSVHMEREQLPPLGPQFISLATTSSAGAIVGAFLLLITPGNLLSAMIPLLLGLATLLFAMGTPISSWLRTHFGNNAVESGRFRKVNRLVLFASSIYGAYFGAGLGVVLLAVFQIVGGGSYRFANAMKNFVGVFINAVATVVFAVQGAVNWPTAAVMAIGSVAGGWVGVSMSRVVPQATIRAGVIIIGIALTVSSSLHYWQ